MVGGAVAKDTLDLARDVDSTLEIFIRYEGALGVHQLARALRALDNIYLVLSHPGDPGEFDFVELRHHLSLAQIDTGNSLTALLFGAAATVAGIAGLPVVAGVGTLATLAAWVINRRKDWHDGSKLEAEGAKAWADVSKTRIETLKVASEISDPRVKRRALIELFGNEFYDSLLADGNVVELTINGTDVTEVA
jgi:hypothetical protein